MIPNKPHILVAPNGFGKSSFAIAFASLNNNRINLGEKYYHQNNTNNKPIIELSYRNTTTSVYRATEDQNQISSEFDIFVINSQLISHAIKQNHGRYSTAIASMRIKPITLINTIPTKAQFKYSFSSVRNLFGNNASLLIGNLENLLKDKKFICYIDSKIDWHELSLKRTSNIIDEICNNAKNSTGKKSQIISKLQGNYSENIKNNQALQSAIDEIRKNNTRLCIIEAFFVLWQLNHLKSNHGYNYKPTLKYYNYCLLKERYTNEIRDLNSSWNNIIPKEENKSLVINFPEADFLSNGQRDFLSFMLLLIKAKMHFKKQKCILIIDEIFDYLDDANLIAFQYNISKLIQEFKTKNIELYPILMTHLDPLIFSHFRLKNIKIHHLDNIVFDDGLHFLQLIKKRNEPSIKEFVNHYLFHYTNEHDNKEEEFNKLEIKKCFSNTETFHKLINIEVKKYLENNASDPFAVCTAIRIKVEKNIYDKLSTEELKKQFIETKETIKKMDFATVNGIEVPEIYYLLSIIYNSTLHADDKNAEIIAKQLLRNLTNISIKQMIASLFPEFKDENVQF